MHCDAIIHAMDGADFDFTCPCGRRDVTSRTTRRNWGALLCSECRAALYAWIPRRPMGGSRVTVLHIGSTHNGRTIVEVDGKRRLVCERGHMVNATSTTAKAACRACADERPKSGLTPADEARAKRSGVVFLSRDGLSVQLRCACGVEFRLRAKRGKSGLRSTAQVLRCPACRGDYRTRSRLKARAKVFPRDAFTQRPATGSVG